MARVSYSSKKNKIVLLGLIVCMVCLLFFSTTFALLAFQESFSVELTLGYISLNEVGKASLDVSQHEVGDLVCSDGISFVKDTDTRNFYARVNIYYSSNDELTMSNKKYLALLNGMIEPASYDDYSWSERFVDSYYLTTTYGSAYEIDEFVEDDYRFYFLDSLTFGQNAETYLQKYDRPEHIYLNVEIQAIQSEYLYEFVGGDTKDENYIPTFDEVRNFFVEHFGDINRQDYQLVLYHDIYNELFDIGFVEYGEKLFEPPQLQFEIGNFKHWCTSPDPCKYACSGGSCTCGSLSCVCANAYDFNLLVKGKLYLYARYDVEMGDIEELYLFKANNDGTYSISQNFKKDGNGKYITVSGQLVPAPSGGIVLPKIYNYARVTKIEYIAPTDSTGATYTTTGHAFGNNTQLTGVAISSNIEVIDKNAFEGCTNIKEIAMFEGLTSIGSQAFKGCSKLVNVSVPDSVDTIENEAFANCSGIQTIELPFVGGKKESASVEEGYFGYIFNSTNTGGMKKIVKKTGITISATDVVKVSKTNPGSNYEKYNEKKYYYNTGFQKDDETYTLYQIKEVSGTGSYTRYIPPNLTTVTINGGVVHDYAFSDEGGLESIKTINFGKNIKSIGNFACYKISVEYLTISGCLGLTEIKDFAFFGCENLLSVKIENNPALTRIGKGAFARLNIVDNISLEGCEALTTLGAAAFAQCPELRSVYFPTGITTISDFAFFACKKLELPMFSEKLTKIGHFAFYECETLTRINLTGTIINEIGHYAFDMCKNISEVKFSRELKKVGNYSFAHCELIGSFSVPEDVEYMGTGCIAGCYKLSELILPFVGKIKETAAGAYTAGAAVQSSSTKYNLFSIIFSTQEINKTEFTLDVSSQLHEVATYDSEFYNNSVGDYSITLQSYYQQSWKDAANKTFYGVHTYLFAFIPKNLSKITVLGGHIRVGAFSGLKTVKEFVIEEGVTGIDRQAFVDAFNVERMTLPFVGVVPEPTAPSILTLFGAIFDSHSTYMDYDTGYRYVVQGAATSSNDVSEILKATQYYGESATQTKDYYIPRDLTAITVLGGKLQYGCLSGMTYLKSATVEEGCKGLGQNMFYNCEALSSLTLGLITDDTDIVSPSTSTLLGYYFGTNDPTVYTLTQQRYKDGDTPDLEAYIPKSLTSITINGGDILYGACMNLKNINSVLVTGNAKSIGKYAFYNTSMSSLTVQNLRTLTTFGDYAFAVNVNLNRVNFANNQLLVNLSNHLFDGCSSITEITYSGSPKLSSAQNSTFANCTAIADIRKVLPETVTTIGDYCFENCTGLQEIILYKTLISAGRYAFLDCAFATKITYLNRNFIKISEGMFKGCEKLSTILIGEFIETIGPLAFSRCTRATSITYNELVTHLPYRCFEYCKGLTQLVIGSKISSMEAAVFSHCENATSILYNSILTKIPRQTFEHCYKLKISLGSIVTKYEDYAFAFAARNASNVSFTISSSAVQSFGKACFAFAGIKTINLTASRTISYGEYCFYENRLCTAITFPNKNYMAETPKYFFANNTSLTSIAIPAGIKLGESCFEYCKGLKTITFDTSVTEIYKRAFRACVGLTTLTIPDHIQKISDEAFAGLDSYKHLFYDPDGDPDTPYYKDLADYVCLNDDNTRYIMEDHIIKYEPDPDFNDAKLPVYDAHPDERGLRHWFNWYFDNTSESICQSAKTLISSILTNVDGNPLGMKITSINFETWSDWKTISGNPSKLSKIGKKAFYMNTSLKSIHFPRALETIDESAFASFSVGTYGMALDYVIFPYDSKISTIGKLAFSNTRVHQLHFVNKSTAPTLSSPNAFAYSSSTSYKGVLGVYVPYGSKASYTGKSNWNNSTLKTYIYDCWNGLFTKAGALPFNIYGNGTSASPYNIFHANQLTYIGEYTSFNGQRYSGVQFGIVRDLYLPASAQSVTNKFNWRPIAYHSGASFDGTLKGVDVNNGSYSAAQRTINNLTIKALATDTGLFSSAGSYAYLGLVGFAGASSIFQNISLAGVTFATGSVAVDNTGSLVASCHGKILDCTAAGSITVTNTGSTCRVGGICGGSYIDGGGGTLEMTNCTNKVNISSTPASYYVAGGIVAYSPYATAKIKNCVNEGTISGGSTNTARNYIGGIMGEVNGHVTIESCTNKANINISSVVSVEVGGIAGRMWADATMKSCRVTNVTLTGTVSNDSYYSFVGAFVGVTGGSNPESGGAPSNVYDASKISFDTTSDSISLNAGTRAKSYAGGVIGGTSHYVRNLTVYDKITATARHVGLVTSMATSYAAVTGCVTNANASLTNNYSGTSYTGGIVGYVSSSTGGTPNNTNNAPITGNSNVGGHYGYMYISGTTLTAGGNSSSRHNKGTIKGVNAGGIVGYVDINSSTITGFRNEGTVTSSDNSGGIIGRLVRTNSNGYITYCYNYSAISSTGSCAGGIIASMPQETNRTNFYIQYCDNRGNISCTGQYPHAGGIIGYYCNNYLVFNLWGDHYTGAVYFYIDDCNNYGRYTGVGSSGYNRIGGIAGEACATLRRCSSSNYTSGLASYAGTLVGYTQPRREGWELFVGDVFAYYLRFQGCSGSGSLLGYGHYQNI